MLLYVYLYREIFETIQIQLMARKYFMVCHWRVKSWVFAGLARTAALFVKLSRTVRCSLIRCMRSEASSTELD